MMANACKLVCPSSALSILMESPSGAGGSEAGQGGIQSNLGQSKSIRIPALPTLHYDSSLELPENEQL